MKHLYPTLLSTLAAGLMMSLSFSAAGAQPEMNAAREARTGEFAGELRYSIYELAREHAGARSAPMAATGQAGRAGPEQLPMGRIHPNDVGDTRFSVFDHTQGSSW